MVARESKITRSSVGRTRFACLPCIMTPQSLQSAHSYEKSPKASERYEFIVMPRQIVDQTRLPPALRHKAFFAYEYPGGMVLAGWGGISMGPVVDCNTCRNLGNIRDYYVYNRVLLE